MIESQIAHVMDGAAPWMTDAQRRQVEVRPEVQTAYNERLAAQARGHRLELRRVPELVPGCDGRNTTLWPSFTFRFRQRARKFNPADYVLTANGASAPEPVMPAVALTD